MKYKEIGSYSTMPGRTAALPAAQAAALLAAQRNTDTPVVDSFYLFHKTVLKQPCLVAKGKPVFTAAGTAALLAAQAAAVPAA